MPETRLGLLQFFPESYDQRRESERETTICGMLDSLGQSRILGVQEVLTFSYALVWIVLRLWFNSGSWLHFVLKALYRSKTYGRGICFPTLEATTVKLASGCKHKVVDVAQNCVVFS